MRCHRLARWRFALVATGRGGTALKMPPACPVEIHGRCYNARVATSFLGCHRLARWRFTVAATTPTWRRVSWDATGLPGGDSRLLYVRGVIGSGQRDVPPDKPGASFILRRGKFGSGQRDVPPGTSRGHLLFFVVA